MRRGFSRRRFLEVAGMGTAAAAMVTPLVRTLRAGQMEQPKRLLVFFSPLGAVRDAWVPTGTENDFTFGEILAPLEAFKSDLLICDGIDQEPDIYDSANHQEFGGILTGKRVLGDEETSAPAHISVDQFIAEHKEVTGSSAFRSLELAAWHGRYYDFLPKSDHMYMSAKGENQPVIPEGLPQAAFDRIFDGFTEPGDEPMEDPRRLRRLSVLDTVAKDLEDVQGRLGVDGNERAKIDQHLTSLRQLENRLLDAPFTGSGCSLPERPGEFEIDDDATLDMRIRMQIDIAVAALACDRTRVLSLTCEGGRSGARHPWLGIDERYHELTHDPFHEEQQAINVWYAQEFNYLLEQLAAVPEGDGSLLDNTVVAWVSEQGCRTSQEKHMRENMPTVLAGSCGGYFNTGRFLDFGGIKSNSVLITLMNAMGIEGNTFGEVTADPLPGVRP